MKVDYLSIHFKTSMISSRTKHESFDSFGSHAQLLMGTSHIFFFCNEPIFSSLFIFKKKYRNLLLIQDQNIRKTLLTKQIIVSKVVFFFQIQRILITLYIGHRFRIV